MLIYQPFQIRPLKVIFFFISYGAAMEALSACTVTSLHRPAIIPNTHYLKPRFFDCLNNPKRTSCFSSISRNPPSESKLFTTLTSNPVSTESTDSAGEKFDWYSQWYPLMPLCDLDKRVPHAKKVLGIDVVLWWDRSENAWKVFEDMCPHRLAPLSEGRIDQWGRLQCVYHGWCFDGSGDCKLIPQAPPDGPPVHASKKACVAVYPSTVQHEIVWFWPNSDAVYKDIIKTKKPPYIPELEDPSFTKLMGNRDIAYGYDVLVENLMDPAHVPYAHYGLMRTGKPKEKVDREGGRPLEISVKRLDEKGFVAMQEWGSSNFVAPCIYRASSDPPLVDQENGSVPSAETSETTPPARRLSLIFICIPVSPGKSRLIWTFPRNFGILIDKILPRWLFHVGQNLILDSDLYLLHLEERKIMEVGPVNWQKSCYVPTKSDVLVVSFRRWFNKYGGGQVDWKGKYSGALPPSPPREELLDRYWSHVVNCRSCNSAYKALNAVEVILQVLSVVLIGIVAAAKPGLLPTAARTAVVIMAVICFGASKWLAHFIYKNFRYHDYNHAVV